MDIQEYNRTMEGGVFATVRNGASLVRVRVLNFYEYADRPKAHVQAVIGDPFTEWTHGGWSFSATTNVPVGSLKDISIYDECSCVLPEQSCLACQAAARQQYGEEIPYEFGG